MGGKDKTSWLEGLEHDDDLPEGPEPRNDGFTETASAAWERSDAGISERKTEFLGGGTAQDGDEKTRISIGGLGSEGDDAVDDPVTGWLVVIEGPGKGRAITVGAGLNRIGRSTDERVALPFGDALISAKDHLRIIYDDEARNFLVVPGSGKNVSRIDGRIIAAPMPLENYAILQLSKATRVRFTAFCGAGFDWSQVMGGPAGTDG